MRAVQRACGAVQVAWRVWVRRRGEREVVKNVLDVWSGEEG
jgi:hypothetical protein